MGRKRPFSPVPTAEFLGAAIGDPARRGIDRAQVM
jgi:hypothetical protein